MKKLLGIILVLSLTITNVNVSMATAKEEGNYTIQIAGKFLEIPTEKVKNEKGKTFIPLRPLIEAIEYSIKWDGETRSIIISNKEAVEVASIQIDSKIAYLKNDETMEMNTEIVIEQGTTYVSWTFMADVLRHYMLITPPTVKAIEEDKDPEKIYKKVGTVEFIDYFSEELARFEDNNGKWGFIDIDGNVVIEPIYDYVEKFHEIGKAVVVYNNKLGVINREGEQLFITDYDADKYNLELSLFDARYNFIIVNKHYVTETIKLIHEEAIIDMKGNTITDFYDWVRVDNGYITISKDEKYGILDFDGKTVLPIVDNREEYYKKEQELKEKYKDLDYFTDTSKKTYVERLKEPDEHIVLDDYKDLSAVKDINNKGYIIGEYKNIGDKNPIPLTEVFVKVYEVMTTNFSHRFFRCYTDGDKIINPYFVKTDINYQEEEFSPFYIYDYNGKKASEKKYLDITHTDNTGIALAKVYGKNEVDVIDFRNGCEVIKTIKEKEEICNISKSDFFIRYLIKVNDNYDYTCVILDSDGDEVGRFRKTEEYEMIYEAVRFRNNKNSYYYLPE